MFTAAVLGSTLLRTVFSIGVKSSKKQKYTNIKYMNKEVNV